MLLILFLLFSTVSLKPCLLICNTVPCFLTFLGVTQYNFNMIVNENCQMTILNGIETLSLSSLKKYKLDHIKNVYNKEIKSFKINKDETYCEGNPQYGINPKYCLGDGINNESKILKQKYFLNNFVNNNDQNIIYEKHLNVSIEKDYNSQMSISFIYNQQVRSNQQIGDLFIGVYTIPDGFGSTYSYNSINFPQDNAFNLPFIVNYNKYDNICGIYQIDLKNINLDYYINCNTCEIKCNSYQIKNIPLINDTNICKELDNFGISIRPLISVASFTFTIAGGQSLSNNYIPMPLQATKIDIILYPYLDFCIIELVQNGDLFETVNCIINYNILFPTFYTNIFNSYKFIYGNKTLINLQCSDVIFDCGTTKTNITIKNSFFINETKENIIGKTEPVFSTIGWWLFFQFPQSLLFWLNVIWSLILCFIKELLIIIPSTIYIMIRIRKLEQRHRIIQEF